MSQDAGLQSAEAQQDNLFRLLVESVVDYAIFLLDPDGCIRTWNVGAERIKGYRIEEVVGKHFSIFYTPEDLQRGVPARALQVAAEEGHWETEGWRVRKDGSRFWANVVITALHGPDRKLVGFAKVTRDLTERKQAEEQRIELLARERAARAEMEITQAKLEAQEEFLAVAAHELKTPMTSAKAAAQLLLRRHARNGLTDPDYLKRSLERIDQQIDRLQRLVTQLLETVRLQSGQFRLARTRTNVTALVADAVEQARARTEQHEIVMAPAAPISAAVDAARLEQVVLNLLDNAVKYSPLGGRIEVAVAQANDAVRIVVQDNGIGIPPEHRARLFERFYQAHGASYQSGLGLGLYISRAIVEGHGGTIAAEFPPEGGTRMVVLLPSAADEPAPDGSLEPG